MRERGAEAEGAQRARDSERDVRAVHPVVVRVGAVPVILGKGRVTVRSVGTRATVREVRRFAIGAGAGAVPPLGFGEESVPLLSITIRYYHP